MSLDDYALMKYYIISEGCLVAAILPRRVLITLLLISQELHVTAH